MPVLRSCNQFYSRFVSELCCHLSSPLRVCVCVCVCVKGGHTSVAWAEECELCRPQREDAYHCTHSLH